MSEKTVIIPLLEGEAIEMVEDKIMVKLLDQELKTSSGIIIPEDGEKKRVGEVIAIGPDEGIYSKVGEKIMMNKFAGIPISLEGVEYQIIRQMDVLCRIVKQ